MEPTTKRSRTVLKYTKNTQAWWQLRTGWSEQEYVNRRAAVIRKVRERWSDPDMLNGHGSGPRQEVSNLLRPLVASFDDSSWSDATTSGERFEKRMEEYTSWAFYLNRHFKLDENPSVTLSVVPPYQPVTHHSRASPDTQTSLIRRDSVYWSETTSDEAPHAAAPSTAELVHRSKSTNQSYFDWDDIEVKIDADVLDLGTVWLPMIDLKPFSQGQNCHWKDFEFHKLNSQFSHETGFKIDLNSHEYVYPGRAGRFTFHRPGAYKVMLKRFSQDAARRDNILRLSIQPRTSDQPTAGISKRTPVMDGKRSDIEQITPPSRAKSLFTGSATDYSTDDSQDMERRIKRLKRRYSEEETIEVALL
ncbi:hypothetical protein LTR70_003649 [Exophiala xenobiotica]|uniref:Uncharacterized protein n=1 Tax=Lithohypha guttulata TaxID=1690604 RepID=A0ABR0KFM0_9EURO|nr:hypothetical protein LTR24_003160 [Lithohypha guttulata]KAK5322862.1 hypothetical protein LTR70_003649 [Exophiala xenobiotica]